MPLLCLKGGRVYDPAHDVDGEVRDVWIEDGRIVPAPRDPSRRPDRVLDVTGCVVMPAGVDLHSHIVGPGVNAARRLTAPLHAGPTGWSLPAAAVPPKTAGPQQQAASGRPVGGEPTDRLVFEWLSEPAAELVRRVLAAGARPSPSTTRGSAGRPPLCSGSLGHVPSSFLTGYLYTALGYGTVFDAAIPPLFARSAVQELRDTPLVDKGFFALVGNHWLVLEVLRRDRQRLTELLAWLLHVTAAYAPKVVNPGGVEHWKRTKQPLTDLDQPVDGWDVTPREIVTRLAEAAEQLGLPHPLHVHSNNLGRPGNWRTTLQTFQALSGLRAHLAHVQFHSYGGSPDDPSSLRSQVPELVDYFNAHPNLTADVGAVLFGPTVTLTSDAPVSEMLAGLTGRNWWNVDTEREAGCGVVPLKYSDHSLVNALQWAIGLEWLLLAEDLWRVALTTDHPNAASFLAYPKLIAYLMDGERRRETLSRLPADVRRRCVLHELTREYSLFEVAIVTRAAPARILGLPHKGHLGPGADADVTVYQPCDDVERMFQLPRLVIRAGQVVVDDGELKTSFDGELLRVAPRFDPEAERLAGSLLGSYSTVRPANYGVRPEELGPTRVVASRNCSAFVENAQASCEDRRTGGPRRSRSNNNRGTSGEQRRCE